MKFKLRTYRSPNDFKFGSWKLEMTSDGGHVLYGILKKTKKLSKFQLIYRIS